MTEPSTDLPDELVAEFRIAAARALAELRPLVQSLGDGSALASITQVAHRLSGGGGSYGFGELSKAAGLVEKTLARELPNRLARLVAQLETIAGDLAPAAGAPQPRTALFGEDDPMIVALVKGRLEREGFTVEHRENGNDILALAQTHDASIIVLDAKLPGLDGFDIVTRLRQSARHARTPILLLTALTGPQDAVRAFELGANDYVRKPFSPAELLARINNLTHDR